MRQYIGVAVHTLKPGMKLISNMATAGWNSKIPGRYSNHGSQKFFETGLGSQTQK